MTRATLSPAMRETLNVTSVGTESGVEEVDDRIGKIRKINEGVAESLSRDWGRLGKLYLDGKINIAVRHVGAGDRDDGVLFEAWPVGGENEAVFNGCPRYRGHSRHGLSDKKSSVFPRTVEIVQCEEKVVPSLVRLEIFDRRTICVGKPLYLFYSSIGEGGSAIKDGEVNVFWLDSAIALGQGHGKKIKAASDAVEDGSYLGVESQWDGFHIAKANELLAGLRIEITDNRIWLVPSPSLVPFLKDWEVGYGPGNASFRV